MYSISRVERETGISKDVLRMWERRYGFPMPSRASSGERNYSAEDLARLLLIKRLMDLGHRPGRLMSLSNDELVQMLSVPVGIQQGRFQSHVDELMALLLSNQPIALSKYLDYWLLRYGLEAFVIELLPSWLMQIGYAWQTGRLDIHHEHLLTDQLQSKLRLSLDRLPEASPTAPMVLLTTLPEEQHGLALLMVENLCRLEGVQVINLGIQTPVETIVQAAQEHGVQVVSLSISEAANAARVQQAVVQLRHGLPSSVALWLGGAGAKRVDLSVIDAVVYTNFDALLPVLAQLNAG
ncbi:MAG: MerR family transcriptional regulator [Gammaproteobacteria bacterium]|nr:MerR family transcriptional regulator [Gammaproteobacteria bacterium]